MLLPFVPILIGAIAACRERAVVIVLLSSFGSAIGGLILYLIFHHLGWNQIIEAYPDLLQSKAWLDATHWVAEFGTVALFAVAASPFAQTPALAMAAITELPIWEVFLAILFGKIIKYGFYAWLVVRFPYRFDHS